MSPRVVVAGVGRAGVGTLIEAIGFVDAGLEVTRSGAEGPTATVGLLVIDPSSVVGDEERALLDRLRAEVAVVAVVCTKVDAFWDWPANAKASRAVLDPAGLLPVFAVSGAAALAGAADESGVDELVRWILGHTDALSDVKAPSDTMARPAPRVGTADEIAVRAGGPDTADDLIATRNRLVRSRDRGRSDRLGALRGGLNRARSDALADLDAGIRQITAVSRDALGGLRRVDVDAHVAWLTDAVASLGDRIDAALRDDLDRIRSVALLGVEPVSAQPTPPPAREPVPLRPPADRRRGEQDALVVLVGASVGAGIGRLVVTPLAEVRTLQWISMPLALVVGVAVAVWLVRVRRIGALRAQMRAWTSEALAEARAGIERDLVGQITAAEPVIAGQVMRHYERRSRMIADDVARIDADIRQWAPGRNQK